MDSSARRRLESIGRHLLPPKIPTRGLDPNPVGAADVDSVSSPPPVIMGGMVLDIHAKPYGNLVPGTTAPGKVQYVSGGVARNIAECMSKLGSKPFMISVVGIDMAGDFLLKYWKSAGLPTEGILKLQDITTPVVSIVFDCTGESSAAVASVEAVETFLTPDWIQQFRQRICSAPVLMIDANLHPQSLEFACQTAESGTPVWFEPVSVAKSRRIASVVNYVTYASPNENELLAMANALSPPGKEFCFAHRETNKGNGQSTECLFQMLRPAICCLLEKGIKLLLVTLGCDGVFLCFRRGLSFKTDDLKSSRTGFRSSLYELVNTSSLKQSIDSIMSGQSSPEFWAFHFPAIPASVVSLVGAGDSLVGGILASICTGLDLMQSVAVGIAVAKATVEAQSNVPVEFSLTTIADEARNILSSVRRLHVD